MALSKIAFSYTFLLIGPIWSREDENAISPNLDTLPYVGFKPTILQKDAGCLTEPPVSLPKAKIAVLLATATALPPLLPPGTLVLSYWFNTLP